MRIALLDDWQGIAETAADWSALRRSNEIVNFRSGWTSPAATIAALKEFDVIMAMRERTWLGGEVIGTSFLVELTFLDGRRRLEGYRVTTLISY